MFLGAELTSSRAVNAIPLHSEVERSAASSHHILATRPQESDRSKAYCDKFFRSFRSADIEVDLGDCTGDERIELGSREVEGAGKTLAQLQGDYRGCRLRTFARPRRPSGRPGPGGAPSACPGPQGMRVSPA